MAALSGKKIKEELKPKLLKLIDYFETSGRWGLVAGDFDGQVLSWGPLQWNIGQGTLIRVLQDIPEQLLVKHLGQDFVQAAKNNQSLRFFVVKNVLNPSNTAFVRQEWKERFMNLAHEKEVSEVFVKHASFYFENGRKLAVALDFRTERGLALCVDIAVQNGAPRKDHISEFNRRLNQNKSINEEWEKLKLLANVVADMANPRFKNVVLMRKLFIAVGSGEVYGKKLNLEKDFGISYEREWFV